MSEASASAWDPRVVVDAAGVATIAFPLYGDYNGLHARSLTPSGTLSPLRDIDGP